jgi:hypothetical protein
MEVHRILSTHGRLCGISSHSKLKPPRTASIHARPRLAACHRHLQLHLDSPHRLPSPPPGAPPDCPHCNPVDAHRPPSHRSSTPCVAPPRPSTPATLTIAWSSTRPPALPFGHLELHPSAESDRRPASTATQPWPSPVAPCSLPIGLHTGAPTHAPPLPGAGTATCPHYPIIHQGLRNLHLHLHYSMDCGL